MLALTDGDIAVWRCGAASDGRYYSVRFKGGAEIERFKYKKDAVDFTGAMNFEIVQGREPEPVENALHNVKLLVEGIFAETGADNYTIYLSPTDKSNFRYALNPEYKANRKDMEKPFHYEAIRSYLIRQYGAVVCDGIEADDAMGIAQCTQRDTIICSIDKDMQMIPGYHYNFVTKERTVVSDVDGWFNFHRQILTGDRTDNVDGLHGIGPAKAERILDAHPDMYTDLVVEQYQKVYPEDWLARINLAAKLLWIQRTPNTTVELVNDGGFYVWRECPLG